jgi:hypothetical protein
VGKVLRCPHVHSLRAYWPHVLCSLRKRKNFSDPWEMRGPTFVVEDREFRSVGRFLSRGSSCSSEMISPPRVHRLSRRDRSVLRDWPELTRWRQKRREAFDHLLAVRQVALFIHPASWPLFEVWAPGCKLICGSSGKRAPIASMRVGLPDCDR